MKVTNGIPALGLVLAASAVTSAQAGVLDFEGLGPGGPVAPITVDGVQISFAASGGIDEAWIYDTSPDSNTNPGDDDLMADDLGFHYNAEFRFSGDPLQEPKEMGNVLIIQENRAPPNPDDNAIGGTLTMFFDEPVTLESIDLLDMSLEGGSFMAFLFDADDNDLGELANQYNGDTQEPENYYETLVFGAPGVGISNVSRLVLGLRGISGAVDNLVFSTSVPSPASLPLVALGTLMVLRRRRRS